MMEGEISRLLLRMRLKKAYHHFDGKSLMVEKFVNFKMEVSVIAARNTKGDIATYPPGGKYS